MPPRAAAAAFLAACIAAVPSAPRAAEAPGRGPDPLIRSYTYNPAKSWSLTSTNLEPLLVVLEPGEQVRGVLGVNVTLDQAEAAAATARGREMWFVAQKTGAGLSPQSAPEEARTVADDRGAKGGGRDKPGMDISDEISFQPTGEMSPTLVRVMTLSADGKPRQHVFVLATRRSDGWPAKPDADAYAVVRVVYPKVPTSEEIAAWRARRDADRQRRDEQMTGARLEQDRFTVQTNKGYFASDGKRSPGTCAAFGLGPSAVAPRAEVSDDGATTAMFFPAGRPVPQIYGETLAGEKTALSPGVETVTGGTRVTLPATYKVLFLLLENRVCGLGNPGYGAGARQPGGGTGTVSPYVVRAPRVAPGYGVGAAQ